MMTLVGFVEVFERIGSAGVADWALVGFAAGVLVGFAAGVLVGAVDYWAKK